MASESQSFDIVIIGGGPGGYAAALYGASAGLRMAIVESDKVGGTCLHRGCVPAKEFLETAHVRRTIDRGAEFGVTASNVVVDFAISQQRKNAVVDGLFKGLTGLLKGRKISVFAGTGHLRGDLAVEVIDGADQGQVLEGRHVILASGSVPRTIPGFDVDGKLVVTSDEFLDLGALPPRAAVIGGGAIGCEFASVLSDMGSAVTILEGLPAILTGCDTEVAAVVQRSFKKRGIDIRTSAMVTGHTPTKKAAATLVHVDGSDDIEVDLVVVSVGRRARTEGLVDESTGVVIAKYLGTLGPILYRETAGFEIAPHTDTRRKVVTMHLYLPADCSQLGLGTALYRRKLLALPFGAWRHRFVECKRFAFRPNSGYAFVVNNTLTRKSWHGREKLPADAGVRNSLNSAFYQPPSADFGDYLDS